VSSVALETVLRVLIVDDVEDDALLAEAALCRGGYTVIMQRVNAAAALDHAQPRDSAIIEQPEASISDIPERLTHESAGRARKSLAAHQRLDPAHTPNDPFLAPDGTQP